MLFDLIIGPANLRSRNAHHRIVRADPQQLTCELQIDDGRFG